MRAFRSVPVAVLAALGLTLTVLPASAQPTTAGGPSAGEAPVAVAAPEAQADRKSVV